MRWSYGMSDMSIDIYCQYVIFVKRHDRYGGGRVNFACRHGRSHRCFRKMMTEWCQWWISQYFRDTSCCQKKTSWAIDRRIWRMMGMCRLKSQSTVALAGRRSIFRTDSRLSCRKTRQRRCLRLVEFFAWNLSKQCCISYGFSVIVPRSFTW